MAKKKVAEKKICKRDISSGSGGMVYVLGFIGALVYYIVNASSFWMGVVGFAKAIVWPAFLVYETMKFLGM